MGSPHLRSILFTKALAAQTGALTPSSRRGLAISKTIGIPYADHAALQDVCSAAGRGADEEEEQQRRRADGGWHMQPQQGGCRGGVSEWRGAHARACKNQTATSLLLLLHTQSCAPAVSTASCSAVQCGGLWLRALTVAARGGRRWQSLPSGSAKEPGNRGHPLSVEGLYCFVVQIFKNLKANASHKFVGRQHPLPLCRHRTVNTQGSPEVQRNALPHSITNFLTPNVSIAPSSSTPLSRCLLLCMRRDAPPTGRTSHIFRLSQKPVAD